MSEGVWLFGVRSQILIHTPAVTGGVDVDPDRVADGLAERGAWQVGDADVEPVQAGQLRVGQG